MPWQELAKIALLGTEHSTISERVLQTLQGQGIDVEQEQPSVLANAAALYAQLRKAGFALKRFGGEMPNPVEFSSEATCSFRSTNHLRLILDGKYSAALPEFIAHLLENGHQLPAENLPNLLQRTDVNEWWHAIQPAIGGSGKWLLSQHPVWKKMVERPEELSWDTGGREERLRLLQHLRQQNPSKGLELLRSTWQDERYQDKVAFLGELHTGISSADEAFLEACLDDRRKEVRRKAAELLAQVTDSALAERMFVRVSALFQWSRGKLKINLPGDVSAEEARDGILKIHPDWIGGAKAGYLGQLMSLVPPSRWEMHWDMEPVVIWKYLSNTDWASTIGIAIAKAAVLHDDSKWMEQMLEQWFDDEESPLWNHKIGHQLMEFASSEMVCHLALSYLERHPGLPGEDAPLFQLLQINDSQWTNELTLQIIGRFRDWLGWTKKADWNSFHYKEFLKMAAYRCVPDLYENLNRGWNPNAPLWAFWEKPIEEMLEVVFFRREMIRELSI